MDVRLLYSVAVRDKNSHCLNWKYDLVKLGIFAYPVRTSTHRLLVLPLLVLTMLIPLGAAAHTAFYRSNFVNSENGPARVHAANIIETKSGIHAAWYAGSREGASDVSIWFSSFNKQKNRWDKNRVLFDRLSVQKSLGRYIKKLGNPALGVDSKGRLWLFFVSVSVGGWSGSSINYSISGDDGKNWSQPKRLVTSPFFNVSTLVRTPAFNFADGSIGLPIYHELIGKFGELLRLSLDGSVLQKNRISWGTTTLQPSIVKIGQKRLLAFLRNSGSEVKGVLVSSSDDGGKHWSVAEPTGLDSFDSSVAAIRDNNNRLLLAFNNSKTGRNKLSLAVSNNLGETWQVVHDFEFSKNLDNEYSYPSLLQDKEGNYHLVYTYLRKRIKHVEFNETWLVQEIRKVERK